MRSETQREWLNASSLGQFEFCARAGVIRHLGDGEEPDPTQRPFLGYSPSFELYKLKKDLRKNALELRNRAFLTVVCILIALLTNPHWQLSAAVWGAAIVSLLFASIPLINLFKIGNEYAHYQVARSFRIGDSTQDETEVGWWNLLRAGYESIEPKESFRCDQLRVSGKPFRYLRRGNDHYAVIGSLANAVEVRSAHKVRLATYRLLMRANGINCSDWGVVVFRKTKRAVLVRISTTWEAEVARKASQLRAAMHKYHHGPQGVQKGNPAACFGCPLGRPSLYKRSAQTSLGNMEFEPNIEFGKHSICGDVFCWKPPHEYAS